ncbi:unnamed protein product [Ectocarpus sp. 4 AP-2014]
MSWLFGSGNRRTPTGQSDIRAARDRQISNLKARVPGLLLKSTDNSLNEVQITAPDGAKVVLRVFLPTKFPSDRPVLQLLSPVTHPWVNTYMQVVGHPDLHGWDGTNPPLIGDIVAAVIQEFGRSNGGVTTSGRDQASTVWGGPIAQQPSGFSGAPPAAGAFGLGNPPLSHPASGPTGGVASAKGYANMTSTAQRTGNEVQTRRTRPPVHHTPIPDIPDTFSELQGLSTEKLNRLLGDESARQALLLGMTNVVRMKDLRTDVRKGNVDTARLTLAKQDTASVLREEGEKIKAELKTLQTSYEDKAHGGGKNMGGTADQMILKRVKHASKMADTSSERVATDFLEKRVPTQDFLDEFFKERQRYHMLAAKIECMKRDIRF